MFSSEVIENLNIKALTTEPSTPGLSQSMTYD